MDLVSDSEWIYRQELTFHIVQLPFFDLWNEECLTLSRGYAIGRQTVAPQSFA